MLLEGLAFLFSKSVQCWTSSFWMMSRSENPIPISKTLDYTTQLFQNEPSVLEAGLRVPWCMLTCANPSLFATFCFSSSLKCRIRSRVWNGKPPTAEPSPYHIQVGTSSQLQVPAVARAQDGLVWLLPGVFGLSHLGISCCLAGQLCYPPRNGFFFFLEVKKSRLCCLWLNDKLPHHHQAN